MEERAKILIIEDDPFERTFLSDLLASEGYPVAEAASSEEAFQKLQAFRPDLILLDVMMPRLDGFELCQLLKRENATKEVPIIMITVRDQEEDLVRGLDLGADDYLVKPIRGSELLARIRTQLRGKRLYDELEKEKRDLAAILEVSKAISSTLRSREIFAILVERMAGIVEALRCSLILVGGEGKRGCVLASSDIPDPGRIEIALDGYPEIRAAMRSKRPVLVEDVSADPQMAGVKDVLSEKGFASILVLPIILRDNVVGTFLLHLARSQRPFTEREVKLCEIMAELAAKALQNAHLFEGLELANLHLEKLTLIDDLTDTYNRRYFSQRLKEEFGRARRYGHPLSLIMLDIDHFKWVNDVCGHAQGDRVLKELTAAIMAGIRKTDILVRYGGEEFVILLPSTDGEGALAEAERIRQIVRSHPFSGIGSLLPLTVSQGVATYPHERIKSGEDLLAEADNALYLAKRLGRDAVVAAWQA